MGLRVYTDEAIHEFAVNLKRVPVDFIASIVRTHLFYP